MPGSLRVETNYSNGATTKTGDGDVQPENKDEKHCKDKLQDETSCDEEFSFSRAFHGVNIRRFSADDSFDFKPVFPIFNENLLFAAGVDGDCTENMDANDRCPFPGTAKRVFVKMPHINPGNLPAGPGGLTDEAADKKRNLAGFSKIWKFKGLIHRRKSAAAVTSAQENYLVRRAMAEERQKAYLAHRTVLVAGGVHSNLGGTAGSIINKESAPFLK